jgi:hypothetical protein
MKITTNSGRIAIISSLQTGAVAFPIAIDTSSPEAVMQMGEIFL